MPSSPRPSPRSTPASTRRTSVSPSRPCARSSDRCSSILAVLAGAYLSLQAPPPLLAVGIGAMLVGFAAYGLRRGGWREGVKLLAGAEDDERRLERWAARRERWLVDWSLRGGVQR